MKKIANGRLRREQRQKEAIERNCAWSTLSDTDKLHVIASRPGESKRERARIQKRLDKSSSLRDIF